MDLPEALAVLGLRPGVPMADVRDRYRSLVRQSHPDLVTTEAGREEANAVTARITAAFAVVRRAVIEADGDAVPEPAAPTGPADVGAPAPPRPWEVDAVEADADGDTIFIAAPPDEAYALLLDAAAQLGGIGYVDRRLGILEVIVRFEGGPSCSVLVTLQGRAFGTDAFCTMESIEAAPTPSIRPVVDALVAELQRPS
ncbi:MAG TPA: J domain-containing protein [Acidimicrobiales bacterium]